ncbi:hypothetical protein GOBAR_AA09624 [Gossypium barbadense]|uniref:Serine/threonine-protein phosphatase 4 regulatory subunit 3-like central domain-containing protein n=1 Tax=Gossypium barbadense TaxID=3634 RepID=A0A2P5Y5Z1_GOSBA|nr:hypothetical protein GOBAR_AA09624 [Gossypium barbadense]
MGAQEKSQGNSNSLQVKRVKVYRLNEDGKWDDQGTGHVSVDYLERSEELALYVFDQEDNETLLVHRICPDDIYRKQEDTIISWRDSEYSTELALSFQKNTGCSYIYHIKLSGVAVLSRRAKLSLISMQQDFFQKLVELFRICEDLENMDVLLNSAQIFEKIFGDELIRDIIGSLECNYITICLQIYYQGLLVD